MKWNNDSIFNSFFKFFKSLSVFNNAQKFTYMTLGYINTLFCKYTICIVNIFLFLFVTIPYWFIGEFFKPFLIYTFRLLSSKFFQKNKFFNVILVSFYGILTSFTHFFKKFIKIFYKKFIDFLFFDLYRNRTLLFRFFNRFYIFLYFSIFKFLRFNI